jgi:Leucine Rich Repeat (LRR) protein
MDCDQHAPTSSAAADGETGRSTPPRRHRRWFQFSLRTLLVVMVLVSAAVGLIGIRMQRARRQEAGAAAITAIGGSALYEVASKQPGWSLPTDLARPWLGDDFFDSVVEVEVDLKPADTTPRHLAIWNAIGDLPQLRKLRVDYPKRYPRSRFNIGPIRRLSNLRQLKIRDAQIAGDDLLPLTGMPALETLDLSHNQIADDAWRHLADVPRLHTLNASYSFVTDAGAAQLAQCRHLRHLVLTRANITDRGAAELARIASLETLVLDGTKISDASCASLSRLENLQTLSICETTVSDAGLASLAASHSLKTLQAERTNVTESGLLQFQSSRLAKR